MDLSATRGELAELRHVKEAKDTLNASTIAEIEQRLGEAQVARDDLDKRATAASERIVVLEAELAGIQKELVDNKEQLAAPVGARRQGPSEMGG